MRNAGLTFKNSSLNREKTGNENKTIYKLKSVKYKDPKNEV
jgi:hypothetical protein